VISLDEKVIILVGGYGSGKTQVTINLAEKMKNEGKAVSLIDLDIINPYFRSREMEEYLKSKGIDLVVSHDGFTMSEAPALSPQIEGVIKYGDCQVIIDVGGDVGATVLGRFAESIDKAGYDMLLVVNVNRPFTSNVESIVQTAQFVEEKSGLKITGIINNTNLQLETDIENIVDGQKIIEKASKKLEVPVKFITMEEIHLQEAKKKITGYEILPLKIHLRPSWLQRRY
jgi:hypothetical protein